MDVNIKTTRVALNTSTGTQDITISGFGTPKAAIFIVSAATADATATADARIGIGFTDGTTDSAVSIASRDALASSNTDRNIVTTGCVLLTGSSSTNLVKAAFSAWITDGVRINIDTTDATAYLCTVVLIGGADVLSVDCGQLTGSASNPVSIVSGFTPTLIFMTCDGKGTGDAPSSQANLAFGIAHYDGVTITQRGINYFDDSGQAATQTGQIFLADDITGQSGYEAVSWTGAISSFNVDGFTMTPGSSTSGDFMGYLAIELAGDDSAIFTQDSATATGSSATTGAGFEPQFGLIVSSSVTTADSLSLTADGFSICTFDDTNMYSNAYSSQDAATTTVAKSVSTSASLSVYTAGSTESLNASLTSLDSDGWTLNYATAPGSAYKMFALAVGGPATATNYTAISSDLAADSAGIKYSSAIKSDEVIR